VLEAHLDTVFPEETDVKIKMRGDTLYALGVGDDTRGLTMVLTILGCDGAHALNEWWLDDNSHLAMQRTLLVLLAEAGVR
jgi:hypothetical protein